MEEIEHGMVEPIGIGTFGMGDGEAEVGSRLGRVTMSHVVDVQPTGGLGQE